MAKPFKSVWSYYFFFLCVCSSRDIYFTFLIKLIVIPPVAIFIKLNILKKNPVIRNRCTLVIKRTALINLYFFFDLFIGRVFLPARLKTISIQWINRYRLRSSHTVKPFAFIKGQELYLLKLRFHRSIFRALQKWFRFFTCEWFALYGIIWMFHGNSSKHIDGKGLMLSVSRWGSGRIFSPILCSVF